MSRWLEAARQCQLNSKTFSRHTAKSGKKGNFTALAELSATSSRVSVGEFSEKGSKRSPPLVSTQIDHFKERAAMLQKQDGLPRDRAAWLAALGVFVLPDERAEYFDQENNLLPQYRRVCLAIGESVTVTFHSVGRVSFTKGGTS